MTPAEQMAAQAAQLEAHARQSALNFAMQRARPDDSIDAILAQAERLLAFVKGNRTSTAPETQA